MAILLKIPWVTTIHNDDSESVVRTRHSVVGESYR